MFGCFFVFVSFKDDCLSHLSITVLQFATRFHLKLLLLGLAEAYGGGLRVVRVLMVRLLLLLLWLKRDVC